MPEPNRISPQEGPQTDFVRSSAEIAIYGGAAGGGKSFGLLLIPLYWCGNPRFGSVVFRRTTKQIKSEGGLWDEATALYRPIGAHPNASDLFFRFPSGAKCSFAHMEHESNRFDWQGAQIPLIGFDELTHFTSKQFWYLESRNRSTSGTPSRLRATCNPDPDHFIRELLDWWIGDDGFAIPERSGIVRWFVRQDEEIMWAATRAECLKRYGRKKLKPDHPDQIKPRSFTFIPASVEDNRILIKKDPTYLAKLESMPRVDRERLRHGNWNVRETAGSFFRRSDFEIVDACPPVSRWVRSWDLAGTDEKEDADDPDWTAGVKMGRLKDGRFIIGHVERFRADPLAVDRRLKNTASGDGRQATIRLAQDPGQAGKAQVRAQTQMLAGYKVTSKRVTGSKRARAKPLSSQVEAGNVILLRGDWNEAFLKELENFPMGSHDDQVDAAADALDELTESNYTLAGVA